jgi:hypothetical protein
MLNRLRLETRIVEAEDGVAALQYLLSRAKAPQQQQGE